MGDPCNRAILQPPCCWLRAARGPESATNGSGGGQDAPQPHSPARPGSPGGGSGASPSAGHKAQRPAAAAHPRPLPPAPGKRPAVLRGGRRAGGGTGPHRCPWAAGARGSPDRDKPPHPHFPPGPGPRRRLSPICSRSPFKEEEEEEEQEGGAAPPPPSAIFSAGTRDCRPGRRGRGSPVRRLRTARQRRRGGGQGRAAPAARRRPLAEPGQPGRSPGPVRAGPGGACRAGA